MPVKTSKNTEEYYISKKDAIKRSLDYYYQNKEKLNKKISCPCLGRYSYKNKYAHIKTKIHQDYLKKLKENKHNSDDSDSNSDSSSD